MAERVLVTGVLGCLGAWVARCVLDDGDDVVGYDLGDARHRLELVLGDDLDRIEIVKGDITELATVERSLDEHEITRVVHLAALQVPFVRANPPLGMHVNVAGTVNVFDAVSRRLDRIPGVMYASSSAVYNATAPSPAPETGGTSPSTLYGVSKLADEGIARVYFADAGVSSIGLRPYVVYGLGRDQGMTSGPSLAMEAAARGEGYTIAYGGTAQYDFAPDVGRAFALAGRAANDGAYVANIPGVPSTMQEVVDAIEAAAPAAAGRVFWEEGQLPFPEALEGRLLERLIGPFSPTSLADGVRATIEHFRSYAAAS